MARYKFSIWGAFAAREILREVAAEFTADPDAPKRLREAVASALKNDPFLSGIWRSLDQAFRLMFKRR